MGSRVLDQGVVPGHLLPIVEGFFGRDPGVFLGRGRVDAGLLDYDHLRTIYPVSIFWNAIL